MATTQVAIISWSSLPVYYAFGGHSFKYKVSIAKGEFSFTDLGVNETFLKVKGLEINSTYCVSLLAYNSFGDGPSSDCVKFKVASGI